MPNIRKKMFIVKDANLTSMFVYLKPGYSGTFLKKCQNKKIYLAKSLCHRIFAEINLHNWKPFKETLANDSDIENNTK